MMEGRLTIVQYTDTDQRWIITLVVHRSALIVGHGDMQRLGFYFSDTFSAVARMAIFHLAVATYVVLGMTVYWGEISLRERYT